MFTGFQLMRLFVISATLAAMLIFAGCSKSGSENPSPTPGPTPESGGEVVSIALTPANPTLTVGSSLEFSAVGSNKDGSSSDSQYGTWQPTWTSSNTSVATIDSNGLAKAVALGTATITAVSGSVSGTATLTVVEGTALGSMGSFLAISAGYSSTCAIKTGGTLWCWGRTLDWASYLTAPLQIGSDSDWANIALGKQFACAIKQNGSLWCWGLNDAGQLGDGTTTDKNAPAKVGTFTDWKSISTNATIDTICGIRSNGTLWCWGRGPVGDGTKGSDLNFNMIPTQEKTASSDWIDVWVSGVSGYSNTCALKKDGSRWCWGNYEPCQLGDGTSDYQQFLVPTKVQEIDPTTKWITVAFGDDYDYGHDYGIKKDGTLWLFANPLVQIGTDTNWMKLSLSRSGVCGIKNGGSVWCWGTFYHIDLEHACAGCSADMPVKTLKDPVKIPDVSNAAFLSLGFEHMCFITVQGSAMCFGANEHGELGDLTQTSKWPTW